MRLLAKHCKKKLLAQESNKRLPHKRACKTLTQCLLTQFSELDNVPEGTIRKQLENIRDTLQGFRRTQQQNAFGQAVDVDVALKPSFQMFENIRRNLRDRASGLPAEGFDAIGQQQARKLAEIVEATQREFAPKFAFLLEKYKADSQLINRFINSLAKRITGRERLILLSLSSIQLVLLTMCLHLGRV
jgi:hypothetical protein